MLKLLNKIKDFFAGKPYLGYIFVAIMGLGFFGWIQATDTFMDPDSFYHAKIAAMIANNGIVHNFPWTAYTVLPQIYTDHHFLYHLLLVPFVWKINPLVGIKAATIAINTFLALFFYIFLRKNSVRWPLLYVFLLLSNTPFIFRINLPKASGLSLIFIIFILLAIFKKKYIWLLALNFFYVWAYGGWPLGIFFAAAYCLASFAARKIVAEGQNGIEWKPLAVSLAGSIAGLMINPYFPNNLKFYWIQTVQIALVNYQSKIGVGAEWYGFNITELISYSGGAFLVLGAAMTLFFGNIAVRKMAGVSYGAVKDVFFFLICAGAFFVLTIKSCRNSEYFYPFVLLLAAFIAKHFYNREAVAWIRTNLLGIIKLKFLYKIFLGYITLMLFAGFWFNFWKIKRGFEGGFNFSKYQEAMAAARKNSMPGDIIFHSDWDDWPMLFYHNDYNRYIVGLDTTFMYKFSKDLYKKWRDITWGDFVGDPYKIIKDDFGAKIVFIAKTDVGIMDKYFRGDGRYELVYDGDGRVYKIR